MPSQNQINHQEFLYSFATHGGAASAITLGALPKGAVVKMVHATVEIAVTSGGAATVALGNATTADLYMAAKAKTTVDALGKVVGGVANALAQNVTANDSIVKITIADAALTAGKIRFHVEYFIPSSSALTSN